MSDLEIGKEYAFYERGHFIKGKLVKIEPSRGSRDYDWCHMKMDYHAETQVFRKNVFPDEETLERFCADKIAYFESIRKKETRSFLPF